MASKLMNWKILVPLLFIILASAGYMLLVKPGEIETPKPKGEGRRGKGKGKGKARK